MSKQSVIADLKNSIEEDINLTPEQKHEQLQQLSEAVKVEESGEITKTELRQLSSTKIAPRSGAHTARCKQSRRHLLGITVIKDLKMHELPKGGRADFFKKRYPK